MALGICPICRGGISVRERRTTPMYHHSCLLRTVHRLPKTVDGVPIVPGMTVFAFTRDCREPGQPRCGHIVRIANNSSRVTVAFKAPAANRSTNIDTIYADYDEAVKDATAITLRLTGSALDGKEGTP